MLVATLLVSAVTLPAQQGSEGALPKIATSTVFARYSDQILKIQVMETASNAKASIGTVMQPLADQLRYVPPAP